MDIINVPHLGDDSLWLNFPRPFIFPSDGRFFLLGGGSEDWNSGSELITDEVAGLQWNGGNKSYNWKFGTRPTIGQHFSIFQNLYFRIRFIVNASKRWISKH